MKKWLLAVLLTAVSLGLWAKWSDDFMIGVYSYTGNQNAFLHSLGYNTNIVEVSEDSLASFETIRQQADLARMDIIPIDETFDLANNKLGLTAATYANRWRFEAEENNPDSISAIAKHQDCPEFYFYYMDGPEAENSNVVKSRTDESHSGFYNNDGWLRCRPYGSAAGYTIITDTKARMWRTEKENNVITYHQTTPSQWGKFSSRSGHQPSQVFVTYALYLASSNNIPDTAVICRVRPSFNASDADTTKYYPPFSYNGVNYAAGQWLPITKANLISGGAAAIHTFELAINWIDLFGTGADSTTTNIHHCFDSGSWRWDLCGVNFGLYYCNRGILNIDYIDFYDSLYKNLIMQGSSAEITALGSRCEHFLNNSSIENVPYLYTLDEPFFTNLPILRKLMDANQSFSDYIKNKSFSAYQLSFRYHSLYPLENATSEIRAFDNLALTHHILNKGYDDADAEQPVAAFAYDEYPVGNRRKWNRSPYDYHTHFLNLDGILAKPGSYSDMQNSINFVTANYRYVKQTDPDMPFFPVVQIYSYELWPNGSYSSTDIPMPPAETQMALQLLPLCYGASGVLDFRATLGTNIPPTTCQPTDATGIDSNLRSDGRFLGLMDNANVNRFVFQRRAIKKANAKLACYGPLLKNETWIAADISNNFAGGITSTPIVGMSVTNNDALYNGYVETGAYQNVINNKYDFMLVNRRGNYDQLLGMGADDITTVSDSTYCTTVFTTAPSQSVTLEFSGDINPGYCLYDPYDPENDGFGSLEIIHAADAAHNNHVWAKFDMGPGEGRLLRLIPLSEVPECTTLTAYAQVSTISQSVYTNRVELTGTVTFGANVPNTIIFANDVRITGLF